MVERFRSEHLVIFNSVTLAGRPQMFCTWSDQLGVAVSGRNLATPWVRLKRPVELDWSGGAPLQVVRDRPGISVTDSGGCAFSLHPVGWRNEVVFRKEGEPPVLARFPAFGGAIQVDEVFLHSPDGVVLLACMGAGLIRRARRLALVTQAGPIIRAIT